MPRVADYSCSAWYASTNLPSADAAFVISFASLSLAKTFSALASTSLNVFIIFLSLERRSRFRLLALVTFGSFRILRIWREDLPKIRASSLRSGS